MTTNNVIKLTQSAQAKARRFAADKDRWLRKVASDTSLTATDLRVAMALSTYLNHTTRYAFPGLRKLAAVINCDLRSVCRSVRKLEAAGHIEVERSPGGEKSNRYWPCLTAFTRWSTSQPPVGPLTNPPLVHQPTEPMNEPMNLTDDSLLRRARLRQSEGCALAKFEKKLKEGRCSQQEKENGFDHCEYITNTYDPNDGLWQWARRVIECYPR